MCAFYTLYRTSSGVERQHVNCTCTQSEQAAPETLTEETNSLPNASASFRNTTTLSNFLCKI